MKDLEIPSSHSFVIADLMGNDTSGFVKVSELTYSCCGLSLL
jgi:cell division control protein 24